MSRIGRKPIPVPDKVDVKIDKTLVTVRGPGGQLEQKIHPDMLVKQEGGQVIVERPSDQRQHRALHGLTRALIANMVTGVTEGFRIALEIEGVGYQAAMQGKALSLRLGFSHDVVVEPPANVTFEVPQDSRGRVIYVDGIDKQVVGQVAANIRNWRPPEPYKGKGIRYAGEVVRRKAGKTGA